MFKFNFSVRETHQIAEAQQEKNSKLREAFGISDYFVDGSSFDTDRKAKEELAKSAALQQELDAQRANIENSKSKKYALVRSPTPEEKCASERGEQDERSKKKKKKRSNDE